MLQFLCVFESVAPIRIGEKSQTHLSFSLQKSNSFRKSSVCTCNISSSSSSSNSSITSSTVGDDLISSRLPSSQISCKSSQRADSVLKLFENHGFSQTQISTVISKFPGILKCDAAKTLKPKIDFYRSLGLSEEDAANAITKYPFTFNRSLKDYLIPSFDLLTTLLGNKQDAVYAIKRFPFILRYSFLKTMESNLLTLRNFGVTESQISIMMFKWGIAKAIGCTSNDWFRKAVGAVMKMGFDPCSSAFAHAVTAMAIHKKESNWQRKIEFYGSFGFSNEDVLSMFKKQPISMQMSEEKIRGVVEFYINKFHWSPSQLSARPNVLLYSLENRIIPRCSVLQILASRDRIPRTVSVITLLAFTEVQFVGRYVNMYKDEVPEVLDAYEGKLTLEEYNFDLGGLKD